MTISRRAIIWALVIVATALVARGGWISPSAAGLMLLVLPFVAVSQLRRAGSAQPCGGA
ncbi:hypothetical protein [Parasphingopyxis marina]|uniref:Uncharacterized protein n=1 Tax=Parasphingopyxis marina TaxID=2761622 RepID=A0A842HSZ8_9SPHN|nr:hypothetical protein [Parasphingopyxis marina]MBC2776206.1 hypothetical protein [Parasphingopyxis marina]